MAEKEVFVKPVVEVVILDEDVITSSTCPDEWCYFEHCGPDHGCENETAELPG